MNAVLLNRRAKFVVANVLFGWWVPLFMVVYDWRRYKKELGFPLKDRVRWEYRLWWDSVLPYWRK